MTDPTLATAQYMPRASAFYLGKPRMPSSRAAPPNNRGKSGNPRPQWGLPAYPCPPVQPAVPSRQVLRAHGRRLAKMNTARARYLAMEAREAARAAERERATEALTEFTATGTLTPEKLELLKRRMGKAAGRP